MRSAEADDDLDECESLLRHAIEMVKIPADRCQSSGGAAPDRPGTAAELVSPVSVDSATPAASRASTSLDEHEALLRRAIEALRGPAPPDQDMARDRPASSVDAAGSVPVHPAPPTSVTAQDDGDLDEIEALLRRAKEMVRDPARPAIGLTDDEPAVQRAVAIARDPHGAGFMATDTQSGMSVLRHQDNERLRTMCERSGWRVVDSGAAGAEDW